ncbi:MAG: LysR family transcriptional regulator [Verrucomicrobiales bacterium]
MTLIDTRQLRAFQLLARSGSFTAAAKELFVTQSAVSHSIKALETSLDCSLLDRAGKHVALTAHGETLLRRVDRIFAEMELATDELKSLNRWGHGKLRVGATDTMCQYLLPGVLREFRESFPNCEVSISAGDTGDLISLLDRGEVDLVLGMRPAADEPGIDFRPLFSDDLIFAVSPLHPWATAGVKPDKTLAGERFIIYARRSPTYHLVTRHLSKLGLASPQLTELGNMEAIKEFSKIGMGVGVIAPWVIREELEQGQLVAITPPGDPMTRDWGIILRGRGANLTMIGETFAGICKTASRTLSSGSPSAEKRTGGL